MSQSHVKRPEPLPNPLAWWKIALGVAVVVGVFVGVFAIANRDRSLPSNYKTAKGKILEVRKVVDGTDVSMYGGKILYDFEARVQYTANEQLQERWLRVSDGMARDTLALKLAAHPTECVVYWPPDDPKNARCWLK